MFPIFCFCCRFVWKARDEKSKNHQNDSASSGSGRMYEITKHNICPVNTFERYLDKLDPKSEILFQSPKRRAPPSGPWYEPKPVGKNTLGELMPTLSKKCHLSKRYTNHSLRSSAITILDEAGFTSRHIMTVSGHRSESSLKHYSSKTSNSMKEKMSKTITEVCVRGEGASNVANVASEEVCVVSLSQTQTVSNSVGQVSDFIPDDLVDFLLDDWNTVPSKTTKPSNFNFANCTVTININQN